MPRESATTDLAHGMRILRRQRALTLDALAELTGLTKSYLSKVERGLSTPSMATALKLANVLGVPLGTLLGQGDGDDLICVVRADERSPLARRGKSTVYRHELIAASRAIKVMEPFVIHPPLRLPREEGLSTHSGEELFFVLKGRVEVIFPNQRIKLGPGDSIYFDSKLPHRARSLGRVRAEVLAVVAGG